MVHGLKEVADGTTNVASPFVGVIDDLMNNLEVPLREKVEEVKVNFNENYSFHSVVSFSNTWEFILPNYHP